jgi:hypothetical protein
LKGEIEEKNKKNKKIKKNNQKNEDQIERTLYFKLELNDEIENKLKFYTRIIKIKIKIIRIKVKIPKNNRTTLKFNMNNMNFK